MVGVERHVELPLVNGRLTLAQCTCASLAASRTDELVARTAPCALPSCTQRAIARQLPLPAGERGLARARRREVPPHPRPVEGARREASAGPVDALRWSTHFCA